MDYVIVLGDTNIVCVDVPETATLAELRVEIELAANDIDEIPREFAFLVKGGRFLQRKEASRKVSTVTGNHRVYIEQLGVARESRAPVAAAPGSRATGRATQEGVAIDNNNTFPPTHLNKPSSTTAAPESRPTRSATREAVVTAPPTHLSKPPATANPDFTTPLTLIPDFTISHCDAELATCVHTSLESRGFKTSEASEDSLGKTLVALVTDQYIGSLACRGHLQRAKELRIPIQPVVRSPDKQRIGEFIGQFPHDLSLGSIDWIHLNERDTEMWNAGITQITKTLSGKHVVKCNQPGEWDIFIGHSRRSKMAETLAATMDMSFKQKDYSPWLDVNMKDKSEAAMKEGVENSKLFIAIISGPCINDDRENDDPVNNAYFKREFCLKELRWAIKAGIPIQPVIRTTDAAKKEEFMELAPDDLQFLNDLHWIELDRDDIDYWTVGMKKIFRQLPDRKHLKLLKPILEPISFTSVIETAIAHFHPGTREWVFQRFDDWVKNSSKSKVFVLSAVAGVGKTGIMSKLSERDSVVAHHFCRHDDSDKGNPARAMCSIAYQLAEVFPAYRDKILALELTAEKLREKNAKALFNILLRDPLSTLPTPAGTRKVVLIDALDECDGDGNFLACIRDNFLSLPHWLVFFITTRPRMDIMKPLEKFNPVELKAGSGENMEDVARYIRDHLKDRLPEQSLEEGTALLKKKSNGVFLYAHFAVERLKAKQIITVDELDKFPSGMWEFYQEQFERLLCDDEILKNSPKWKVVKAVITAREPLRVDELDAFVECTIPERKQAVAKLSLLFPIRDRRVHVNHKSVKDWLVDPEREDEMCYVDEREVHIEMGKKCIEFYPTVTYALKHGVAHLCEGELVNDACQKLVMNFKWLLTRLSIGGVHRLLDDIHIALLQSRTSEINATSLTALRKICLHTKKALDADPRQLGSQLDIFLQPEQLASICPQANSTDMSPLARLLEQAAEWIPVGGRWRESKKYASTYKPPSESTLLDINVGDNEKNSWSQIAFLPDGEHIVISNIGQPIRIFDANSGEIKAVLDGQKEFNFNTCCRAKDESPEKSILKVSWRFTGVLIGSDHARIKKLRERTGVDIHFPPPDEHDPYRDTEFTLTSTDPESINLAKDAIQKELNDRYSLCWSVNAIAVSHSTIVAGLKCGRVQVWTQHNVNVWSLTHDIKLKLDPTHQEPTMDIKAIDLNDSGPPLKKFVTAERGGGKKCFIRVYSKSVTCENWTEECKLEVPQLYPEMHYGTSVVKFSEANPFNELVSGGEDGIVRFWRYTTADGWKHERAIEVPFSHVSKHGSVRAVPVRINAITWLGKDTIVCGLGNDLRHDLSRGINLRKIKEEEQNKERREGQEFAFVQVFNIRKEDPGVCHIGPCNFIDQTMNVTSLSYDSCSKRLAVATDHGILEVWQRTDGWNLHCKIESHTLAIHCIAFSANGEKLASTSVDGSAKISKILTQTKDHKEDSRFHTESIKCLSFSKDGSRLVTGSFHGQIQLWNVQTCAKIQTWFSPEIHNSTVIHRVLFNPGGDRIISAGHSSKLVVWKEDKREWCPFLLQKKHTPGLNPHESSIKAAAVSPDGNYIVAGSNAGFNKYSQVDNMTIWKISDIDEKSEATYWTWNGHSEGVAGVAYSHDGSLIASCSHDTTVKIWLASKPQQPFYEFEHRCFIPRNVHLDVAFTDNSQTVVLRGYETRRGKNSDPYRQKLDQPLLVKEFSLHSKNSVGGLESPSPFTRVPQYFTHFQSITEDMDNITIGLSGQQEINPKVFIGSDSDYSPEPGKAVSIDGNRIHFLELYTDETLEMDSGYPQVPDTEPLSERLDITEPEGEPQYYKKITGTGEITQVFVRDGRVASVKFTICNESIFCHQQNIQYKFCNDLQKRCQFDCHLYAVQTDQGWAAVKVIIDGPIKPYEANTIFSGHGQVIRKEVNFCIIKVNSKTIFCHKHEVSFELWERLKLHSQFECNIHSDFNASRGNWTAIKVLVSKWYSRGGIEHSPSHRRGSSWPRQKGGGHRWGD